MKFFAVLAIPLAIVAWGAVLFLARYAGLDGFPLLKLYINATLIVKSALNLLTLGLPAAAVLTILHLGRSGGADRGALIGVSLAGVGLGLLATAFGFMTIWIVMKRTHTTHLRVVAPSAAEDLMPIAMGLTIAAICGLGILFGRPKPRSA